jgi:2-hydroxychromene-2-carboxylate isomerase
VALRWYFDVISPFAYLQWPRIEALARERPEFEFRPLLFAGLLDANGQKGPAEIPAKRRFTYRQVMWLAQQRGMPMQFPPAHPFNPLAALRTIVAAGSTPAAIGAVFDWIWVQGRTGDSVDALAPLLAQLGVAPEALGSDAVKAQLRANFDLALAEGVFGVPTLAIDGELFWGQDAHDFALAVLADPGLLAGAPWQALDALPLGAVRKA